MPTHFGVQFKLFWYYGTQRRAGRPRSSPSPPFGGVCEYQKFFRSFGDEGKPRPYNVSVFWFWAIEIPMRVGDPVVGLRRRNRLAVGCPPYVCQSVLAFSSNLFGTITHRGGRDARVPVLRRLSAAFANIKTFLVPTLTNVNVCCVVMFFLGCIFRSLVLAVPRTLQG
ncbi:MAG: hypothetical protein LBQ66_11455 [Planctomycetaceae bacterium]|nr:hypothetical protein [Planctomycetaceae bacterium]